MIPRRVFSVFTILCLLILAGALSPAHAAAPQSAPEIEAVDLAAMRFAIGDELEYEIPIDTMMIIGRYNVTIDPTENRTIRPSNLNAPVEAKGCTPIGALDVVARSGELNYTTYYYTTSDRLVIDSINEYEYGEDQIWYVLSYLNETYHTIGRDARAHNLTDGETFWLIYCDLSDYDLRYESRTDRAIAGLSITVMYGKEAVTPLSPGFPPIPMFTPEGGTPGPAPPPGLPSMPMTAPLGEDLSTALTSLTDGGVATLPMLAGGAPGVQRGSSGDL